MAKIALITGSSRGLGKNTALPLAKKGVDVIVTYHSNLEEANKVVSAIEEMGVYLTSDWSQSLHLCCKK